MDNISGADRSLRNDSIENEEGSIQHLYTSLSFSPFVRLYIDVEIYTVTPNLTLLACVLTDVG